MNTTHDIFKRDIITNLELKYEGCEYDSIMELEMDIYSDSEIILEDCVKDSITDVVEDGVGKLAGDYLKEMEVTTEMLLEIISNPEQILYYAYCAVLDEAVEDFVEDFDCIENWD